VAKKEAKKATHG